jgi:hypothetical protein
MYTMFKKIPSIVLSTRLMALVLGISVWFVFAPKLSVVFIPEGAPVWFPKFIRWTEIVFYPPLGISMSTIAYRYRSFFFKNAGLKG